MSSHLERSGGSRALLLAVAVGWTLFALYGSLVPLSFVSVDLAEAWDEFRRIVAGAPRVGSRSDLATNFLLLFPSAFFGLGALWSTSMALRVSATVVTVAFLAGFACLLEFLQVYVPGRTVSRRDIEAQMVGAAAGAAFWMLFGHHVDAWLSRVRSARRRKPAIELLLLLYTVLVIGYGLLPLDLTLSPGEILDKFQQGRVILVPFTFTDRTWEYSVYSTVSEVALWAPAGAYFIVRSGGTLASAVAGTIVVAAGLELAQLFIMTRTVDVNDVIASAIGGTLGGWAAARWRRLSGSADGDDAGLSRRWVFLVAALVAWALTAMTLYWYPFDFRFDGAFLRDRMASVHAVPFHSYYWGSEFNATTQLFRKASFFVPLGMLLGWGSAALRTTTARATYMLAAVGLTATAAVAIEVGQLVLPGKVADPTDAMLAFLGAVAGWVMVSWVMRLSERG